MFLLLCLQIILKLTSTLKMTHKTLQLLLLVIFISIPNTNYSQNLLNATTWTAGTGSVPGFVQIGVTAENSREFGLNHLGANTLLWKATPNSGGYQSGGWITPDVLIDHTQTYRYSVWIKKTNSNDGHTYLGCKNGSTNGVLSLSTPPNSMSNPYFWYGDLPKLNRWYLIVGFVHGSGYTSLVSDGGIYDGVTGEKVVSITDFKFSTSAIATRHRAFLYYDANTNDRQYSYAPRIEKMDGSQLTIEGLMGINLNSKLLFSFDNSGNQKQRFYCSLIGCPVPTPPLGRMSNNTRITAIDHEKINTEETININNQLSIYPNPTQNLVHIEIDEKLKSKIESIRIYNANSLLIQDINLSNLDVLVFNLKDKSSGVYFVHIHLNDGSNTTLKVIKK